MKRKLCVDMGACVPKAGQHDDAAMRLVDRYESNDPAHQRARTGRLRSVVAIMLLSATAGAHAAEPALMSGGIYSVPNSRIGGFTQASTLAEICNQAALDHNALNPTVPYGVGATSGSFSDPQFLSCGFTFPGGGANLLWGRIGLGPFYSCRTGLKLISSANICVASLDVLSPEPSLCNSPPVGHPIYPLTGSKRQSETLGNWIAGETVALFYDTVRKVPSLDGSPTYSLVAAPSFGEMWHSSLHKSLVLQKDTNGTLLSIQASRGSAIWVSYKYTSGGVLTPGVNVGDRLVSVAGGYRYFDAKNQSQETYDTTGKLLNIAYASGARLTYTYSVASTPANIAPVAGLLIQVQDHQGRSVQFQYEQPSLASPPRIYKIIDPKGQSIGASYDGQGNLSQLIWADSTKRSYVYGESAPVWALTGVIDENSNRLATYGYQGSGRASETQWAGGVDHFSVSYGTQPSWDIVETYDSVAQLVTRVHKFRGGQGVAVTLPNGSTSTFGSVDVQGAPALTSQSQVAGSGCAASVSARTYDVNGNVASVDDFNQHRTCSAYDLVRNLPSVKVEGLASTTTCTTVLAPASAVIPAGSRKISSTWHPDWPLTTAVAEPGRRTTLVYNGQPDPFAGGATASCAPAAPALPDGKPIAVLCKQVEQATTDADGHLGFSATLQSGVPNRQSSWTYDQYGQVLTAKDPIGNTTTASYYTDTTADHLVGDLSQVANAKGQLTRYTQYDRFGNVLQSVDANSVTIVKTYDQRQRLTGVSVGGQATSYSYWPTGLLKRVSAPDLSFVNYEYDIAQRLTAVVDVFGNRIDYTYDLMGNRTSEKVKDPGGTLTRQLTRTIDALGRVQQTIGRP